MRKLLSALFIFGICLIAQDAFAGAAVPPGPGASAPIDGAAGLLLMAVAGYGYSRLKKNEASNEADQPNV